MKQQDSLKSYEKLLTNGLYKPTKVESHPSHQKSGFNHCPKPTMNPDIDQLPVIVNLGQRGGGGCLFEKHLVQPLLKHVLRHLLCKSKVNL